MLCTLTKFSPCICGTFEKGTMIGCTVLGCQTYFRSHVVTVQLAALLTAFCSVVFSAALGRLHWHGMHS